VDLGLGTSWCDMAEKGIAQRAIAGAQVLDFPRSIHDLDGHMTVG
jgi:hypothetical protein